MIYSSAKTLTGHKFRHEVAEALNQQMDMFGYGHNGRYLTDKKDSLDDYMFQVVIENCKRPLYSSEKIYDCFKTKTVPIYWGGEENLKELGFDLKGILCFDTVDDLEQILKKLDDNLYQAMLEHVEYNHNRLIELRTKLTMGTLYHAYALSGYFYTVDSTFNGKHNKLSLGIDQ